MSLSPRIIYVSSLALAVLGIGLLASCAQNDTGSGPPPVLQPAAPIAVETTKPERRSVSRLISLPGDIHPWEETTLYSKVPGYLNSITVDKGDRVRAGQIIAKIDAPELSADRDQAQQAYESSMAAALASKAVNEQAGAEHDRSRRVVEKARADYAQVPAAIARAHAQLRQAQGSVRQAQEERNRASAAVEESLAQVEKVKADLEAAQADQQLADVTFSRYESIYVKNPMLLARQEVDVAESRAKSARARTSGAREGLEVAQRHVQTARSQVNAADSEVEQAQAALEAAQEQVNMAIAEQRSAGKQVEIAAADVAVSGKQQAAARARTLEAKFQAKVGRSAIGRAASFAEYTRIRAPFDGVVTKRFLDRGAFIQSASTSQNAAPIVTVANLSRLRVYFTVPETQARFVQTGTVAIVNTAGQSESVFKGRVSRTSGTLDPKTRTLLAEVDLANDSGRILAGTYASGRIVMETHPGVLSVPSPAVGVEKAGKFVYIVSDGKARRVAVVTGFDDGAHTEILQGLQGNENVVVTGREALTPNARVTESPWIAPIGK